MKRYKAINFEYDDAYGTGTALDIVEHDEGEFVRYDDIRNLLQNTSSNSDYAKLPNIDELKSYMHRHRYLPNIVGTLEAIKKLGNFA